MTNLELATWTKDEPTYRAMGARYIDRATGNYLTWVSNTGAHTSFGWSSDTALPDMVALYQDFSGEKFDRGKDSAVLRVPCSPEMKADLEQMTGEYDLLSQSSVTLDMPGQEAAEIIREGNVPVLMASIGFRATLFAWTKPYLRFNDSEIPKAEINIGGKKLRPIHLAAIGKLLRATTNIDPPEALDALPIKLYRHGEIEEAVL